MFLFGCQALDSLILENICFISKRKCKKSFVSQKEVGKCVQTHQILLALQYWLVFGDCGVGEWQTHLHFQHLQQMLSMLFGSGKHSAACLLMDTSLKGAEWRRVGCLQHCSIFTAAIQMIMWQLASSYRSVNTPSLFSVAVFALPAATENFWMGCSMINTLPCYKGWGWLSVLTDRLNYMILNSDSVWGVFVWSTIKLSLWLFI